MYDPVHYIVINSVVWSSILSRLAVIFNFILGHKHSSAVWNSTKHEIEVHLTRFRNGWSRDYYLSSARGLDSMNLDSDFSFVAFAFATICFCFSFSIAMESQSEIFHP